MLHPTRPAALAAALAALALTATACASRQTRTDSQTTPPAVTQAPGGPADPGLPAQTLPAAPAPRAAAPAGPGQPGVSLSTTTPGATAVALADVFFGFDESTLSPEARQVLDRNAEYLRRTASARVQIEGHADERGSTAYNLALGDRRAVAARRYLESLGIEPSRISTISFGEEKPFVPGQTEEAWAQNRRGHFVEAR